VQRAFRLVSTFSGGNWKFRTFSFKCYVDHPHILYSSGNIDVWNWVHLFESRCICIYFYFIHIYNHVYVYIYIYIFTFAFNSDTFVFMTWGEEFCTNFDKIKYTLRAHVVLYDSETLSSSISQKHEVTTTEGNVLEILFEPDTEEIVHRTLLHKEVYNLYSSINN
jgi:hypothetical protein